jgi:hypothetical protein
VSQREVSCNDKKFFIALIGYSLLPHCLRGFDSYCFPNTYSNTHLNSTSLSFANSTGYRYPDLVPHRHA